jgi:hypothetical protein
MKCKALVDCANLHMCPGPDAGATLSCTMAACPNEFAAAAAAGTSLLAASNFGGCVATAGCDVKCPAEAGTEGGSSEGGSSEGGDAAKPDTSTTPEASTDSAASEAATEASPDTSTTPEASPDSATSAESGAEAGGD